MWQSNAMLSSARERSFAIKCPCTKNYFQKKYADFIYDSCTQTEKSINQCLKIWSWNSHQYSNAQTEFIRFINQPGGASVKTILHYIQLAYGSSGPKFQKFKYENPEKNLQKYGRDQPPIYNLTKITAKTQLFAGFSDSISTLKDVLHLHTSLPNSKLVVVKDPEWNHVDFSYSPKVKEMIFDPIIRDLRP